MALTPHPGAETGDIIQPGYDAENVVFVGSADYLTGQSRGRAVYVGGAGHVTFILQSGRDATFYNVPVGMVVPQAFVGIRNATTTATFITAMV